jgi:hypothetical protein
MTLLFDPYAYRHWSFSDVRVVNKVADALVEAHEDIDLNWLSFAITKAYRPGMRAHALMTLGSRDWGFRGKQGQGPLPHRAEGAPSA